MDLLLPIVLLCAFWPFLSASTCTSLHYVGDCLSLWLEGWGFESVALVRCAKNENFFFVWINCFFFKALVSW